jgi:hypothetical protein
MTTAFEIVWPFTSRLKFLFCSLMAFPLLMLCAPTIQALWRTLPQDQVQDAPLDRDALAALPLAGHAYLDHPERTMDAAAIRLLMLRQSGSCHPVEVWVCTDKIILTCPADDPKLELGLVVGTATKTWKVVTGYLSSDWQTNTIGCAGPIPLP